jgi:hypothetical protein
MNAWRTALICNGIRVMTSVATVCGHFPLTLVSGAGPTPA